MVGIDFLDSAAFGAVPRSHQIAVVGESSAKEGMAIHVVWTDLKAEPAFQAFGHGILMGMVSACRGLVFSNAYVGLFQILVNRGSVHHQVVDHREFSQRPDFYLFSLQVSHKRFAGKRGA